MNDSLRLRMDWATTRDRLGASPLDIELQAERASSLGRAGARLERALTALAAAGRASPAPGGTTAAPGRPARAAWEFMVIREMAGLHDWSAVIRMYAIPRAVLNRMGAFGPKPGAPR